MSYITVLQEIRDEIRTKFENLGSKDSYSATDIKQLSDIQGALNAGTSTNPSNGIDEAEVNSAVDTALADSQLDTIPQFLNNRLPTISMTNGTPGVTQSLTLTPPNVNSVLNFSIAITVSNLSANSEAVFIAEGLVNNGVYMPLSEETYTENGVFGVYGSVATQDIRVRFVSTDSATTVSTDVQIRAVYERFNSVNA